MKIAYLTNQYPHVRHTFIRREIVALETLGAEVLRFSMRDSGADCPDPADQAERQRTRALLKAGPFGLLLALAGAVFRCGVDEAFLQQSPGPVPDTNRLVLVAGLAEQKGHLLLLRALAEVARRGRDFEMLFVGDGPLRGVLEAEIGRLKLAERVRIT